MYRILYTAFIFISILIFSISCKNTNHLEDGALAAVLQMEELETVDTLTTEADEIVGIYKSDRQYTDEDACELSIEISGSEGNYKYFLRSKKQDINGALFVVNSELEGEHNLMLFGKKREIRGGDNNTNKANPTTPNENLDTFNDNVLLVVNAGSNKDSFTFFNDCAGEYIKFSKQ